MKFDNLDCCPVCGHTPIETCWDGVNLEAKYKCHCCGWNNFETTKNNQKEPEKENGYDDFANEMYELSYSLYKAGFRGKEERAHILGGMAPIIYSRTEIEKARKTVESMPGLDGKPGSGGLGGGGWG